MRRYVLGTLNGREIVYGDNYGDAEIFSGGTRLGFFNQTECCGVYEFTNFQRSDIDFKVTSLALRNFDKIVLPPCAGVIINIVNELPGAQGCLKAVQESGWVCAMTARRNPNSGNHVSTWMYSFNEFVLEEAYTAGDEEDYEEVDEDW